MSTQRPLVFRVGTSITLNRVLRNQMRLLADDGWTLCCVCDDDEWAEELRALGLGHAPLGMGRRPSPLAVAMWGVRFFRLCRRTRPDIVHTHNAFHGIAGRVAARLAGVPVVVQTVHNWYFLEPSRSPRARVFRLLEKLASHFCDAVLLINTDDFERALAEHIVPRSKRRFIGNGIDVRLFDSELAAIGREEARRELGIADDDVVLSMVARLEPPKDHDMLLSALPEVVKRVPRLQVVLAGHGLRTDEVRARVAELDLESRVHVLGHRDDVATIMRASDAHTLVSQYEGFGRCLVEAMVAEIPVVGTDVPGIRDVIDPGRTGLLVEHGDVDGLARALTAVLAGNGLRDSLIEEGRRDAVERFDERRAARRVGDVYAELLGQTPKRDRQHG